MTDPSEQASELANSDHSIEKKSEDKVTKSQRGNNRGPKQNKGKWQSKQPRRKEGRVGRDPKGFKLTSDGLLRHFLGCRVCCYFFTGLQVQFGRDVVDRLVDEFDGKWVSVPFSKETQSLMHKTYGLRVDSSDDYIDYSCEVCCRRFEYEAPEIEQARDEPTEHQESIDIESVENDERAEIEPEALPQKRLIDVQVAEWNAGKHPMLKIEFKHKR